jgi:hypothetical protein
MSKHVKLPGFFPLHNHMSLEVLESIELLAWLTVDGASPVSAVIQEQLPKKNRDQYLEAIHEIGVIAQEARIKKQGK